MIRRDRLVDRRVPGRVPRHAAGGGARVDRSPGEALIEALEGARFSHRGIDDPGIRRIRGDVTGVASERSQRRPAWSRGERRGKRQGDDGNGEAWQGHEISIREASESKPELSLSYTNGSPVASALASVTRPGATTAAGWQPRHPGGEGS